MSNANTNVIRPVYRLARGMDTCISSNSALMDKTATESNAFRLSLNINLEPSGNGT